MRTSLFVFLVGISFACAAQSARPSGRSLNQGGNAPSSEDVQPHTNQRPTAPKTRDANIKVDGTEEAMAESTAASVVDSAIRIAVLLPFDYATSSAKIYGLMNDKEHSKGDIYRLKEQSRDAMDFYQGLMYAAGHTASRQRLEFFTYDTQGSDSVVGELLKLDELRSCQLVIGPSTPSEARIVAAWCRDHRIVNIQPLTPSKSVATANEYLVRFMPTIDAHLQKEYEMVIDSFAEAEVIVYTSGKEHELAAARQLDTLFQVYNKLNSGRLHYTFYNNADAERSKRSLSAVLSPTRQNVLLVTSYDEPLVNSVLRTLKDNTIVLGMPTWIDGDQLRPEYLNKTQPYLTDNFHVDSASAAVSDFVSGYAADYDRKPSRQAYMGYDALNYLLLIFQKYGLNIREGCSKESYEGLGFGFHISPLLHTQTTGYDNPVSYYTNTAMHLYQVRDYHLWYVR